MATTLKYIESTNGAEDSKVGVTVFAGAASLLDTEETRKCVQITVERENTVCWGYLTESAIKTLIKQLQSVLDGNYEKYTE